MRDGGLRRLFQQKLPDAHWQPVESWSTGQGVPDTEYCFPGGASGWLELKKASRATRLDHPLTAQQTAWLERRRRVGGRAVVAVRYQHDGGPRKGPPVDELRIYDGAVARGLETGIYGAQSLAAWQGGPAAWDWPAVRAVLCQ